MSVHPVLRMGDPLLTQVSTPVKTDGSPGSVGSPELRQLVSDMFATMTATNGAGLAAPQIGVLQRVMIFGAEKKNPRYPTAGLVPQTVLINPEMVVVDETLVEFFEGCLSVPGLRGPVLRPTAIRYKGLTVDGEVIEREVDGFHARVFQHEMDHLDGILFPMRVKDFSRFGFTEELEAASNVPRVK